MLNADDVSDAVFYGEVFKVQAWQGGTVECQVCVYEETIIWQFSYVKDREVYNDKLNEDLERYRYLELQAWDHDGRAYVLYEHDESAYQHSIDIGRHGQVACISNRGCATAA